MKTTDLFRLYKPYDGPAGPDEDQVRNNNLALKAALEVLGIPCDETVLGDIEWVFLNADDGHVLTFDVMQMYRFSVGYDRWGFVLEAETHDFLEKSLKRYKMDEIDQADIDTVLLWFYNLIEEFSDALYADQVAERVRIVGKRAGIADTHLGAYIAEFEGNFEPAAYYNITDLELIKDIRLYIREAKKSQ